MTAGTAGATASSPQRRGRIVATGRTAALMTAHQPLGMGRMTAGAGRFFVGSGQLFKFRAAVGATVFVKRHDATPYKKKRTSRYRSPYGDRRHNDKRNSDLLKRKGIHIAQRLRLYNLPGLQTIAQPWPEPPRRGTLRA